MYIYAFSLMYRYCNADTDLKLEAQLVRTYYLGSLQEVATTLDPFIVNLRSFTIVWKIDLSLMVLISRAECKKERKEKEEKTISNSIDF